MERGHSIWVSLCKEDFQRMIPEKTRTALRGFVALIDKYATAARSSGTMIGKMTEQLLQETGYLEGLRKAAKEPEDFMSWEGGAKELLTSLTAYDQRNRTDGLGGFKVKNPNAVVTCSCGESFAV